MQSFNFDDNSTTQNSCCKSRTNYFRVIDYGTYYNPAWKHYERQVTVMCDRCGEVDIQACLGLGEKDLCLMCAHELTRKPKKSLFLNKN